MIYEQHTRSPHVLHDRLVIRHVIEAYRGERGKEEGQESRPLCNLQIPVIIMNK
jgi:hypothetical protein